MDYSDGIFIDVRELDEWLLGHLEGACHVPLSELERGKIPVNLPRDRPLYLYCARGRRAKIAQVQLAKEYPNTVACPLGFDELVQAGY